jgi:hypothetical protein
MRRRAAFWILAAMLAAAPARGEVKVGPEFQVNAYTTGSQDRPSIAAAPAGGFLVVWHSAGQDGDGDGAFARRLDAAGTPLGAETQVNTYTTSNQRYPSVAAQPAGGFVAAWHSTGQDGDGYGVYARGLSAAGTPVGAEFRVNAYTTASQSFSSVATDQSGNFVVAWQSYGQDGIGYGIFGRRFDAVGTPQGAEFQVSSYTTGNQRVASVARAPGGSFVVVWHSQFQDGSGYGVLGQRFDAAGTRQGAEFQANVFTTNGQTFPSVAADPSGGFVVVWQSYGQDGGGYGIFGRRYDAAGSAVGGEFAVSSYTTSSQRFARVARDSAGGFVVVWHAMGQDGSGYGAFGQRLDATGTRQGAEFQVNTYTTSTQGFPAVATGPREDFVVVWQSDGPDGSLDGVLGQRLIPDRIFADGFESGDLSAWSSSETGSGDLSASAGAALAGTAVGLQAVVNDTGALYVRDDRPDGEGRYRVRFYFDPNGFDPGEAQGHRRTRIFIAFDESPVKRHIALVLRRVSGQYGIQCRVRVDDNSQADTGFFDVSDAPHFVELDWKRATSAVSNDGSLEMWIDGVSVSTLPALGNNLRTVDFVRLGPQSLKGGAAGTLRFDELDSRRLTAIGP